MREFVVTIYLEGRTFRCSMAIATGELIIGAAPADVLAAAKTWSRRHRALLMAKWQELNG
jgi:hypothetical protein